MEGAHAYLLPEAEWPKNPTAPETRTMGRVFQELKEEAEPSESFLRNQRLESALNNSVGIY